MSTTVHFIDVGQGNLVLIQCADGSNIVADCNVHDGNESRVLGYVARQIGQNGKILVFINTHRDADHIRGIRALHRRFPIGTIWDSGHPGSSTDSSEYAAYMRLRREVGSSVVRRATGKSFGGTNVRILSDDDSRLPDNPNDRGLVVKITDRESVMLTGDGSLAVWRDGILKDYGAASLYSCVLMAAHHGARDFFWDSVGQRYTQHIADMSPAVTVISVGKENPYGHPDIGAVALYRQYSRGLTNGRKVLRIDNDGTVKVTMGSPSSRGIVVSYGQD